MRKNRIFGVRHLEQMVPIRNEIFLKNGLFRYRLTSNLNVRPQAWRVRLAASQEVVVGYLLELVLKSMRSS